MSVDKPVYIISDNPEKESDLFGFDAYAKAISDLISYNENRTPLVIGIYGHWGSGKTTLMKTIRSYLNDAEKFADKNIYRKCKTVWFQAWKYKEEDEILAALIEEIFKTMSRDGFFSKFKSEIESFINRFEKLKVFGKITETVSGVDISDMFRELPYKDKLGFYDTFQDFFDRAIWTYLNWRPKFDEQEKPDDSTGVLVVFIDDLDRCPQEKILTILETVKLFMDKECCIFVIGAAHEMIEKALAKKYGEEDATKFMDKIVQVTFNLPQIPPEDFQSFIERISPDIREAFIPHLHMVVSSMNNNPRRLKRFLNNMNLVEGLVKNKNLDILYDHLLYWNIIDYVYPALRDDLKDNPQNLFTLKEVIQDIDLKIDDKEGWMIPQETLERVPQSLRDHIQNIELVSIVKNFNIQPEQLKQLITLSSVVESVEEAREKGEAEERIAYDNVVEVSGGPFLYGSDKHEDHIDQAFQVDVYPVTNSQHEQFMNAGGYSNDEYWSDEGKQWKEKNNVIEPRYWNDEKWNQPDHPVVGISYFEAEAYSRWAGKRLLTEQEWEKVARGSDGWEYPWGDTFDKDKCNTKESGIGKTTRVTRYPNGTSPYGCYDMAGNIWEWTSSDYEGWKGKKVLRGGSWADDHEYARCANRYRFNLDYRIYFVGFRCARSL